jgi:hypothetical protein
MAVTDITPTGPLMWYSEETFRPTLSVPSSVLRETSVCLHTDDRERLLKEDRGEGGEVPNVFNVISSAIHIRAKSFHFR